MVPRHVDTASDAVRSKENGGTAVAERPERTPVVDDFEGTDAELCAEIDRLAEANRRSPGRETERRLMALRHIAGIRALGGNGRTAGASPSRMPPGCRRRAPCPSSPPTT